MHPRPLIANPFRWAIFFGVPHFRDGVGIDSEPGTTFPELYDELRRIAHWHLGAERTAALDAVMERLAELKGADAP